MKKNIALILATSMILCACGGEQPTKQTDNDTQIIVSDETVATKKYELTYIEVPEAEDELEGMIPESAERYILLNDLAGENLVRLVEVYPEAGNYNLVNYYVQILKPSYSQWETFNFDLPENLQGQNYYVKSSYADNDGKIKMLLTNGENCHIGSWQESEGFIVKEIILDTSLSEVFDTYMFPRWYYSEAEGLFLINEQNFSRYDNSGERVHSELADSGGLILKMLSNPHSEKLYFAGVDAQNWSVGTMGITIEDGGFSIWTCDNKDAAFVATNTPETKAEEMSCFFAGEDGDVVFSSESEGYICNQVGVFQFSMEDQSRKLIFDFAEAGMGQGIVSPIRKMDISVDEDGIPIILCDYIDGNSWFAKLDEQSSELVQTAKDKQQLELAVVVKDAYLEKAIVDFNKQSENYEVVLRACEENESADDYRKRIQAELSAGEGPDIMNTSVLNTASGAQKGFLRDLTDYYNSYQDQFFATVKQLGKVEDKYYGIPYSFGVMTMVADQNVVGNATMWTLEEAVKSMEESGTNTFFAKMDGAYTYYYLGVLTENQTLIDWNNNKCHLNESASYELLDFATRYSQSEEESIVAMESLAKGECLAEVMYLTTPTTMKYVTGYLQGREVYIGFPTGDNSGGHCLTGDVLQVNRNSSSVEGAVEFIDFLLSEERQNDLAESMLEGRVGTGYPVNNSVLEKLFDDLKTEAVVQAEESGELEEEFALLEPEQYDKLWEVLENAHLYDNDTGMVLDILIEEGEAYWSGVKTTTQVMDIVNNRVQLYLNEK